VKTTFSEKMRFSQKLSQKVSCQSVQSHGVVSTRVPKLFHVINSPFKMSRGQTVLDPNPELINARSLNFMKSKLFFRNIGCYAATSTYIHVGIPLNFSQILNTQQRVKSTYTQLLSKLRNHSGRSPNKVQTSAC
jgi:hypothetical protein